MQKNAHIIETARNLFRQFAKFGAVGVMNTLLYYALYLIFLMMIAPVIAYYVAYVLSMANAVFMNLKFTFKEKPTIRKIAMFVLVYLISMYIGGLVLAMLIGLSISAPLAGFMTIGVTVVTNFLGLKAAAKWA